MRDLTFLAEEHHQGWASALRDLLLAMHTAMHPAVAEWRPHGARLVPLHERAEWIAQYSGSRSIMSCWPRGMRPTPATSILTAASWSAQADPAQNLLDALLRQAERVLAFLTDRRVPFTNNQAERDLRMVKVQQKIAGTFRSEDGASAYCRVRSYLSTMRKQGRGMLEALTVVFHGAPSIPSSPDL